MEQNQNSTEEVDASTDPEKAYTGFLVIHASHESGIYPYPAMTFKGKEVGVYAIMLSPHEAMQKYISLATEQEVDHLYCGLDRTNENETGVDKKYNSIFTIFHLSKTGKTRYGVFPYTPGGEHGEIDWDNPIWIKIMSEELIYHTKEMIRKLFSEQKNTTDERKEGDLQDSNCIGD